MLLPNLTPGRLTLDHSGGPETRLNRGFWAEVEGLFPTVGGYDPTLASREPSP
jgi:hypothetical protein